MKCAGCGEEFPNLNALTKHKPDCPAGKKPEEGNESTQDPIQDTEVEFTPEGIKITADGESYCLEVEPNCIIPITLCPSEIKYYAPGKTVGLRVEGKYTPKGVEVQEVKLIR